MPRATNLANLLVQGIQPNVCVAGSSSLVNKMLARVSRLLYRLCISMTGVAFFGDRGLLSSDVLHFHIGVVLRGVRF